MSEISKLVNIAKKEYPDANYFSSGDIGQLVIDKYISLVEKGLYDPIHKRKAENGFLYDNSALNVSSKIVCMLEDYSNAKGIDKVYDALYDLSFMLLDIELENYDEKSKEPLQFKS